MGVGMGVGNGSGECTATCGRWDLYLDTKSLN